jgi:hypothetical protein
VLAIPAGEAESRTVVLEDLNIPLTSSLSSLKAFTIPRIGGSGRAGNFGVNTRYWIEYKDQIVSVKYAHSLNEVARTFDAMSFYVKPLRSDDDFVDEYDGKILAALRIVESGPTSATIEYIASNFSDYDFQQIDNRSYYAVDIWFWAICFVAVFSFAVVFFWLIKLVVSMCR